MQSVFPHGSSRFARLAVLATFLVTASCSGTGTADKVAADTDATDIDAGGSDTGKADAGCMPGASPCPVAVVQSLPADPSVPGSSGQMVATASKPGCGQIVQYQWTVTQQGQFVATVNGPTFDPPPGTFATVGEYSVCLAVWDSSGVKSCVSVCQQFLLIPTDDLHIELLWQTPGKPDGASQVADLDLHFAHPTATGPDLDCDGQGDPWFAGLLDCWSWNNSPDWGLLGTQNNPSQSGESPSEQESINIDSLQGDAVLTAPYTIGVHYWDDHGWGPSIATVRGFANGSLMFETKQTTLQPGDMWNIGRIWSPNVPGAVSMEFCGQTGNSCQAGQNLMWSPGGKECIRPCYGPVNAPVGMTPYVCP
jgi:hypothetical protein